MLRGTPQAMGEGVAAQNLKTVCEWNCVNLNHLGVGQLYG